MDRGTWRATVPRVAESDMPECEPQSLINCRLNLETFIVLKSCSCPRGLLGYTASRLTASTGNYLACVQSRFSRVQLFVTLLTLARQAPLSMDSPGKDTGVGCHVLLCLNFLTYRLKQHLLRLLHWQAGFFTTNSTWEAQTRNYLG